MRNAREAASIIRTLESSRGYVKCRECDAEVRLADAGLFYLGNFTPEAREIYEQLWESLKEDRKDLRHRRRALCEKSESGARAVNMGFVLERIATAMRGFAFDRNDCRSLFDPIDYIIFEGLSRKGKVSRILFVDIKTGGARLTERQRAIRALVERGKVEWDTYRMEGCR